MSWPMAIVWIVAIVAAAKVLAARYRANAGIIKDQHGNQTWIGKGDPADQREIEELRERIKVLEQITVEGRETRALADQIEQLRDK